MAQSPVSQFSGIFVSYRRDDSSGHAGRLFDNLAKHFGEDQLFIDIDTIEPGEDFVEVIEKAVGSCEIVIAVMGPRWLSSSDGTSRRLDNPNDFVRLEIATALKRDVRVIPVLVQRATMPRPQDLPEDIVRLSRRNAVELSDSRWKYDVERLISVLERVLVARQEARRAEAARQAEEERERRGAEEKRRAEEEAQRLKAAEEANRKAEEDRRRDEEERQRQAVEERQRAEEQQKRLQAQEAERHLKQERINKAEAKRRAEEETGRRLAEEAEQRAQRRIDEQKAAQALEQKRLEEEKRRQLAAEEAERKAAEEKRRQEESRTRQALEERKRAKEEQLRLANEEAKHQATLKPRPEVEERVEEETIKKAVEARPAATRQFDILPGAATATSRGTAQPFVEHSSDLETLSAEPETRRRKTILIAAVGAALLLVVGILILVPRTSNNSHQVAPNIDPRTLYPPDGMVYVKGGDFMMGRDGDDPYESPAHKVTVKPFFIDVYEVTCEDYKKFLSQNPRQPPPPNWIGRNYPSGFARKPVTGVDWYDASAYAIWAGKRLPTEAEWEFAARGKDGWRYPWGNEWRAGLANADGASGGMVDVGRYPDGKSPFGAFDMVGNAWEWTASDMAPYPGGRLPKQPVEGTKVLRGGSYPSNKDQATATYRHGWGAMHESSYAESGFRCVKDISKNTP